MIAGVAVVTIASVVVEIKGVVVEDVDEVTGAIGVALVVVEIVGVVVV